jgi:uncharacterized protein YchJ
MSKYSELFSQLSSKLSKSLKEKIKGLSENEELTVHIHYPDCDDQLEKAEVTQLMTAPVEVTLELKESTIDKKVVEQIVVILFERFFDRDYKDSVVKEFSVITPPQKEEKRWKYYSPLFDLSENEVFQLVDKAKRCFMYILNEEILKVRENKSPNSSSLDINFRGIMKKLYFFANDNSFEVQFFYDYEVGEYGISIPSLFPEIGRLRELLNSEEYLKFED